MQPHGTPCWIDLTTELAAVKPFYAGVLGWRFEDLPPELGGWTIAHADGPVAALGPGEPRDWQVFLRADDIQATAAAVPAAGGEVTLAPGEVGEMGWAAQVRDPGGACVGLWQPGEHRGFTMSGAHGTPAWMEVNTRVSEEVRDFFGGLFGLSHQQLGDSRYYTLHAEGRPRFGVLHMNHMWEGMDPCWMVYFAVDDLDAACAAVADTGGQVEYPPFDTPFGRIAICRDPCGTPLTLVRPAAT